jgi:integrase
MTKLSVRAIVTGALADLDLRGCYQLPTSASRKTDWLDERGLGVRRYATGRAVYVVQTRMSGRCRTITIAPTSVITEHQAAMIARRVMAHAELGHDPANERLRIRSAPMFQDLLDQYWQRAMPRWKPSTRESHDCYRRLYLDGAFAGIFVDELSEDDVTRWFAALNDETGPGAANRVLSILGAMLNKAEEWGYRRESTNPCRSVRRNRTRKIERFLSHEELRRLGDVLATDRTGDGGLRSTVATAVTLLLLTGCRSSEVARLQWQDVKGNRLKLRDSKTGPRTVWLGDKARGAIDGLPRHRNVPWLFWNAAFHKPVLKLGNHWPSIRDRAGLSNVRLHDLRHTFASHAAMSKETLPMIGRLLGHRSQQSTSRYAHLGDEHVSDAAQQIGAEVAQMLA